jgi:hypothetical protein
MCRRLGISRASYYRWLAAEESPTAARHRELTEHVRVMFDSSDGIFGHRMVHTKLAAAGIEVSVGTVAIIMAENGWAAKRMRAFKRTTIPSDPDKLRGSYRAGFHLRRPGNPAGRGHHIFGSVDDYVQSGRRFAYAMVIPDVVAAHNQRPWRRIMTELIGGALRGWPVRRNATRQRNAFRKPGSWPGLPPLSKTMLS